MRVHEVAKLLGKSSKEVIAALKQQGIDVQSHMSTVTDEQVDQLKNSYN
ncbi:MAG: translation initiation factor IF-2 N-terminal domain-containing protein, partial [Lachnospiraceae bacterium]|nr:translation initiation factor IF-2 N-terminal domain-containing protein [Lachnospiraceae bacterium]